MGLLDKIKGAFGLGSAGRVPEGYSVVDGLLLPTFTSPPKRGSREVIEAYNTSGWLRAVQSKVSKGVGGITWRGYAAEGKDGKAKKDARLAWGTYEKRAERRAALKDAKALREVEDHPLLDLLAKPNPAMMGMQAISLTQTWMDLKGEGFWLIKPGANGIPDGFFPIPPHWVLQTPTEQEPFFRVGTRSNWERISPANILWLRDLNPADPYTRGTGVGEALGDELETDEYIAKHLKSWFFNNAVPGFIVAYEGANEASLKEAQTRWEGKFKGPGNANRVHFSGGKMNAVRIDTAFKDQELQALRRSMRDLVREVYGVPPEIMGIIENSNRATAQAAGFLFAQNVLLPRAEFLRSFLQTFVVPLYDDRLVLDFESPVPEDRDFQLSVVKAAPFAFNLNEIRSLARHEPIPEFDSVFPPLALPGQAPEAGGEAPAEDKKPKGKADPPWVAAGLPRLPKESV